MRGFARTAILMAGLTALIGAVGMGLGGGQGMLIALLFAGGMNLWAWYNSDKAVLRHFNARQVGPRDAPQLYEMTERLSRNAGLPMPRLYLIDNDQPNAFATGRNPDNAAVAVNTGLIRRLSADEVEGVVAHELAHIKHRDTLIMTVTATFAGAISMLAQFGMFFGGGTDRNRVSPLASLAMMILAPIAAMLVQMAISRAREYEADREGAEISGRPEALASALEKIAAQAKAVPNLRAEANPASASLFIINPLHLRSVDGLFSTHPKTEERIRRLMDMRAGFAVTHPGKAVDEDIFGDRFASFSNDWSDDFATEKSDSRQQQAEIIRSKKKNPWK